MGTEQMWLGPASGWRGGTPDRETGGVRWDPADGALSLAFSEADWTPFRSLHLDLSSLAPHRRTHPAGSPGPERRLSGVDHLLRGLAGREPDEAVAGQPGAPRPARALDGGGRHPSVTPQGGPVADGARWQAMWPAPSTPPGGMSTRVTR